MFGRDAGVRAWVLRAREHDVGEYPVVGYHGAGVRADGEGVAVVEAAFAVGGEPGVEQRRAVRVLPAYGVERLDQLRSVEPFAHDELVTGDDGEPVTVAVEYGAG